MKSNSKKHMGFGLVEIVISMMILSIVSVSVYSGFIMIIKQTKAGQVKQTAALEGKKVIEELQASVEDNSFSVYDNKLTIGNAGIDEQPIDSNGVYIRYLNENYENGSGITADNAKYTEKITVTPTKATKADNTEDNIGLNTNYKSNVAYNKFYISKVTSGGISTDNINYWTCNTNTYSSNIPLSSKIESGVTKIDLSVYLEPVTTEPSKATITIKDYKGQPLALPSITQNISGNLVMNFSKYKEPDGSLPSNVDIEINMYNKTSNSNNLKVYIEKQKDLNVNVEVREGGITIYDNWAENIADGKIKTLYDVKVEIINKDNTTLFTGYSKKNIH